MHVPDQHCVKLYFDIKVCVKNTIKIFTVPLALGTGMHLSNNMHQRIWEK